MSRYSWSLMRRERTRAPPPLARARARASADAAAPSAAAGCVRAGSLPRLLGPHSGDHSLFGDGHRMGARRHAILCFGPLVRLRGARGLLCVDVSESEVM